MTAGSAVVGAAAITAAPAQAAVLHGDTSITSPPAQEAVTARIISPPVITVQKGEYLSEIAAKDCGSPSFWTGIFAANRGKISNPDLVYEGEILVLSCKTAPLPKPVVTAAAVIPQQRHAVVRYSTSGLGGNLSFSGLERLWITAGGPSWAASSAASVAECESGGRQNAYNPSGASGYWQILGEVISGNVFDPMTNARNAVAKFEASGDTWAQWVCKP